MQYIWMYCLLYMVFFKDGTKFLPCTMENTVLLGRKENKPILLVLSQYTWHTAGLHKYNTFERGYKWPWMALADKD